MKTFHSHFAPASALILLFGTGAGRAATIPDWATDMTTPSGTVTCSASHDQYPGSYAFDNVSPQNPDGRWLAYYTTEAPYNWFTYQFDSAVGITHYRVSALAQYNVAERSPKHWTLSGSNDNTSWTVVDERVDEPTWSDAETRTYEVANPGAYQYYQFTILERGSELVDGKAEDYTGVGELEYFSIPKVEPGTFEDNLYTLTIDCYDPACEAVTVYYGTSNGGADVNAWASSVPAVYDELSGNWKASISTLEQARHYYPK